MLFQYLVTILFIMSASADFWSDRKAILSSEDAQIIGSEIVLSEKEQQVNSILMKYKRKEYDEGFETPGKFNPSRHFFLAKNDIENSTVFQIIQKLPKGATLHAHDTAIASLDYLYSLTYRPNLYGCVENGGVKLHFFNEPDTSCNWKLVKDLREADPTFDELLKSQISIIVDNPYEAYPDINAVWSKFAVVFGTITPMLTYAPVWKDYFYQILKELYEDNTMYMEFRGTLPECYDVDGTKYKEVDVVGFYVEVLKQFKLDYPDFQGARFIYAPSRKVAGETVDAYVDTMLVLNELYPDFMAGFDLVGQEDLGEPLSDFIPQLQRLRAAGITVFFHAGETNWWGSTTDINVIDAILLGTKRIGHGYALLKHPEALKMVKDKQIAIEVSPISNQVLKLIEDMRNHPASHYIANNYPMVICNDDPTFWGAKALSHDWYMAYLGMTSRDTDLKFLKQMALNTFKYNVMQEAERAEALVQWEKRWELFLDNVIYLESTGSLSS